MQIAHLHDAVSGAGGHHADLLASGNGAIDHAQVDDDAAIGVILAVEDQRAQRSAAVAFGGRNPTDNILQHGGDIDAVFGGDLRRIHGGQANHILNFMLDALGVRRRQVNLIDHRKYLKTGIDGQIGVSQCLSLHALSCVHNQHRAFTGGQGPGDLIVEVHMSRCVDEVQHIGFAVLGGIFQAYGAGLDGDAALALQLHIIQQLIFHLTLGDRVTLLQQPVCQRAFAVVNVGDDGEVAQFALVGQFIFLPTKFVPLSIAEMRFFVKGRNAAQWPEVNFRPMIPTNSSAAKKRRRPESGSWNMAIPTISAPSAPIPVQIA